MISLRDVVTGFGNRDPLAEVWRRNLRGGGSAEITGTLPLYYNAKGTPLTDYLISGNTLQNGTPTPEASVDVVGCGVRTENLAPNTGWVDGYISMTGILEPNSYDYAEKSSDFIPLQYIDNIAYSYRNGAFPIKNNIAWRAIGLYKSDKSFVTRAGGGSSSEPLIVQVPNNTAYIRLSLRTYNQDVSNVMLNLGSTALPYKPYGYKLPLTVNGTEYPIYLGTVPTTRRIKKLVLTGEESWSISGSGDAARFYINVADAVGASSLCCTHFTNGIQTTPGNCEITASKNLIFNNSGIATTTEDWKTWLAAQYANGTPVTVWYILAVPETGIVNEPLMKIGDYADTISFTQAGVTIPTVSGANVLNMTSPVKPSEVYIKGRGIKPTGYGQLVDKNDVRILDKNGTRIFVHGQ